MREGWGATPSRKIRLVQGAAFHREKGTVQIPRQHVLVTGASCWLRSVWVMYASCLGHVYAMCSLCSRHVWVIRSQSNSTPQGTVRQVCVWPCIYVANNQPRMRMSSGVDRAQSAKPARRMTSSPSRAISTTRDDTSDECQVFLCPNRFRCEGI